MGKFGLTFTPCFMLRTSLVSEIVKIGLVCHPCGGNDFMVASKGSPVDGTKMRIGISPDRINIIYFVPGVNPNPVDIYTSDTLMLSKVMNRIKKHFKIEDSWRSA